MTHRYLSEIICGSLSSIMGLDNIFGGSINHGSEQVESVMENKFDLHYIDSRTPTTAFRDANLNS